MECVFNFLFHILDNKALTNVFDSGNEAPDIIKKSTRLKKYIKIDASDDRFDSSNL